MLALFDKANPANSVVLGKTRYAALNTNSTGSTKLFNTAALSDSALQKEVFEYAQQLAGGRALAPTAKEGLWNVTLDNGTNLTVRSVSSSQVGRWTIEIKNQYPVKSLTGLNKVEVKFK